MIPIKTILIILAATTMSAPLCGQVSRAKNRPLHDEVIYHIFLRSFRDSNGDGNGDLRGVEESLDYLEKLGVTALLISPVAESECYHNYFASSFRRIDPEYGTVNDFRSLMTAAHRRHLHVFLDMEVQYITAEHEWYRDSFENPDSRFTDHIIYNGPGNTSPESIIFGISKMPTYNGKTIPCASLNLNNAAVRDHLIDVFQYWTDPNGDGDLSDGVDGFRIDHMMDDLDGKGIQQNLFANLWKPLIDSVRRDHPKAVFIAEQADWSSNGDEYFSQTGVDAVFAFSIEEAVAKMNAAELTRSFAATIGSAPDGHHQLVFIENHDLDRFASRVNRNPAAMQLGAALNLLIGGVPSIYYGQELGMPGRKGDWGHDGNDIPRREAFEWHANVAGDGTALWYRHSGPWWDATHLRDNDGISVEEQAADPDSLLNWYRTLIRLRQSTTSLKTGSTVFIDTGDDEVLMFIRDTPDAPDPVAVIANFSAERKHIAVDLSRTISTARLEDAVTGTPIDSPSDFRATLTGYGVQIIRTAR